MIKIDNSLLQDIGLGSLPDADKDSLLKHIYETLEMRVGMRLADQMSDQQLDEFEQYFQAKDDAGAFKWLETNFPHYKQVVEEEFEKLKAEVQQAAPQILAAANQAMQPGFPPPAAMPDPAAQPASDDNQDDATAQQQYQAAQPQVPPPPSQFPQQNSQASAQAEPPMAA